MSNRWQIPLVTVKRYLVLYTVLVLYSAAYEQFYAKQLTPLYHDRFTAYDYSKTGVYALVCFLTPLAILPIGTRLRAAGQFIAGAMAIFIFIPIPIVFVPMVTVSEFWSVYGLLWLAYFGVCSLSSIAVEIPVQEMTETKFRTLLIAVYTVFGFGLVYVVSTNHFDLVALNHAHAALSGVTVTGVQGYLISAYISSFGGLLVALAIMYRRYYLLSLAVVGFLMCYGVLEARNAVLLPMWITYIFVAHKLFFRNSVIKYLITVMGPFFLGTLFATIIGTTNQHSLLYYAFALTNYRLFSVPAIGFNVYYNFFQTNPHTYWSHINFISKFVSNPYGTQIGLVMADAYRLGNYNASFLETDGLAAAGPAVLPYIGIFFGAIMVWVNSCMRGLNATFLAIVTAGSAVALVDVGIGPGLITNGLALLSLVLLAAPRSAAWNLSSGTVRGP